MAYSIAIDGPAGAGKSTIAKIVAGKLGFIYVDTGAMYRAIALYLTRNQIEGTDEAAVAAAMDQVEVSIRHEEGEQIVLLNGERVNHLLRTEEVSRMASVSSQIAAVRTRLVELQRTLARTTDVIMDGRDIGTVVLPDAGLKIYLTADAHVRALRRYKELTERGDGILAGGHRAGYY